MVSKLIKKGFYKAKLIDLVEQLTGQKVPFKDAVDRLPLFKVENEFSYSQFNEILLTLGYDLVTSHFFNKFFNKKKVTIDSLEGNVENFQKTAILLYGNVKYAFKKLSKINENKLNQELKKIEEKHIKKFKDRTEEPLDEIKEIDKKNTYMIGVYFQDEIRKKAKKDKGDIEAQKELRKMEKIVKQGNENYYRYLSYDYMDVYVATSMRQKHEYGLVNEFITNLKTHKLIKPLRLRFFDPTQANCVERIDKGLLEALMLKRAECTIYLVQENDTLGKDSELAATLAQGKPVIAYVPELKHKRIFIKNAFQFAKVYYPKKSIDKLVLDNLQLYYPEGAWKDKTVKKWITSPECLKEENELRKAIDMLFKKASDKYNKRANSLHEKHPLGIQVNLENGVANGVLVVRSLDQCAKLLKSIILNKMEFIIKKNKGGMIKLREIISNSVYRVVTDDEVLTNSFWNYYLK